MKKRAKKLKAGSYNIYYLGNEISAKRQTSKRDFSIFHEKYFLTIIESSFDDYYDLCCKMA